MTRDQTKAGAILGATCVVLLFTVVLSNSLAWVGATFPGFFVTTNRVVSSIALPSWEGAAQLFQNQLVTVDGTTVGTGEEIYRIVRSKPPGTRFTYGLLASDGGLHSATLASRVFSWGDFALIQGSMAVNGLAFAAIGLFVLYSKPNRAPTYGLLSATLASGTFLLTAPDLYGPYWFFRLHVLAETFITPAFIHLALVFPTDRVRRHRRSVMIGLYAPFIALALLYESVLSQPSAYINVHLLATALHGVAVAVILVCTTQAFRSAPALVRRRIGIAMLGIAAGVGVPLALMAGSAFLGGRLPVNAGLLTAFLFPLSLGYAVVKQDLFEIDLMLRRGIAYIMVLVAVTSTYFLTIFLVGLLLPVRDLWDRAPATVAILNLLFLLMIAPIRDRVRNTVHRVFFRKRYDAEAVLAQLSQRLATARAADEVATHVLSVIGDSLSPASSAIALYGGGKRFVRLAGTIGTSGDILLPADLIRRVGQGEVLARYEWEDGSGTRLPALWRELDAEVIIPIGNGGDLIGVIILGPLASRHAYTAHDVVLLQTIANQVVVAMSNASAFGKVAAMNERLEQQVRERTLELEGANSDLNRSLQELRRAYELLERNQASLLRADRLATLGRLAAGMAHEINTPLGAVLNSLQVVVDLADEYAGSINDSTVLPDDHRQIASEIRSTAESAATWARKATGYLSRTKLHGRELQRGVREAFAVKVVADETQHLLAHRLRAAVCTIDYTETPAGISLVGDQLRLGQVLVNLVSNAIDAYEDNGVIDGRIEITASRTNGTIILSVHDWAGGIPPQILPRIFDELFTTKEPGKGTGLGLWIARNLVEESFGGHLSVDVTDGVGSCFTATFPVCTAVEAPGPLVAREPLGAVEVGVR